jgi:hypothetical protein
VIGRTHIHNVRYASAEVEGEELVYTPRGASPIDAHGIDVEYSITEHRVSSVVVRGRPADGVSRRTVKRRIATNMLMVAPDWVRRFVAKNMP